MKIIYSSTKNDFFVFYFSQIFLKKKSNIKWVYDFSKIFNISDEKIRSIEITNKDKISLFKAKNLEKYQEFNFINDFYKEIEKEKMDFLIRELINKKERLYIYLEKLFGKSNLPEKVEISFVQSPIKNAKAEIDAFTTKATSDKIFFNFDNSININDQEKIEYYILVLLHELTHVFINYNKNFQNIKNNEWKNKYKNINENDFKINIEELIVSTLIFPVKNIGYAFKALNILENEEKKKESLEKNRYRQICIDFLKEIESVNYENKIEIELPKFIENIVGLGMFKND